MFISWLWIGAVILAVLSVLLLLALSPKHRLACVSALSVLAILAVVTLWFRSRDTPELGQLRFTANTASTDRSWQGDVESNAGGICLDFRESITVRDPEKPHRRGVINPDGKAWVSWGTMSLFRYPEWHGESVFKAFGFQLVFRSEYEGVVRVRRVGAIVFPAWFPIPFLLIAPALYVRQWKHRRKVRRWIAAGCCAKCGFDLRAHRAGEKCPECSTVIPATHNGPQVAGTPGAAGQQAG
jgi:hypothetical protein